MADLIIEQMPVSIKEAVHHVVINPQGKIKGPVGSKAFVKQSLIEGWKRTFQNETGVRVDDDEVVWEVIKKYGYRVVKAKITLLEEE